MSMRLVSRLAALLLTGLVLCACESASDRALQKSPDYRAGYSDGCASAAGPGANMRETGRMRDEQAYKANRAYSVGWDTGFNTCRNQSPAGMPSLPGQGPIADPHPF
jgi:hypothetical protein